MYCDATAIEVRGLTKQYQIYAKPQDRLKHSLIPRFDRLFGRTPREYGRQFSALNGVSFDVKPGEVVGIVGRNGSGKSTLLQLVCGTLAPTAGSIVVNGRVGAILELGAGFNPDFTGRENAYLNGLLLGLTREEMDQRIEEILTFADIGDFVDQPVKTYSSGMFARLAFSVQASLDPEILIVDEALAVGDSEFVHKCMVKFHAMRAKGKTILLVTHDATAVKTLCDRALWLDNGALAAIGEASSVVDQYLAAISEQSTYCAGESEGGDPEEASERNGHETEIPNVDSRLGDGTCEIVGVGLYDSSLARKKTLSNGSPAVLRITIRNRSLSAGQPLLVGVGLRNARGVDIASINSEISGTVISAPNVGERATVRIDLFIPELHPGSYAFRVSISRRGGRGEVLNSDDVINAVVFDLISQRPVHVLMLLDATFSVEL